MGEASRKAPEELTGATGFGRVVDFLSRIARPLNVIEFAIGGTVLVGMMFLTFVDVAGRYFFSRPISGSFEITELSMAVLVSFGIGYTAFRKRHIRVDLIMQYTPKKVNAWIDVFTYLISTIFFVLITWQAWNNAITRMNNHLTSAVLFIPVYPFAFILVVGAGLLTFILLKDFIQSVYEVTKS